MKVLTNKKYKALKNIEKAHDDLIRKLFEKSIELNTLKTKHDKILLILDNIANDLDDIESILRTTNRIRYADELDKILDIIYNIIFA
jgi:DNA-directed RNA polymerase subunit F